MKIHELVLAALCVWRITHLFQAEDGPWDLVLRLRRVVGEGFFGQLLDCFYCLSLWIAAPFAWGLGGSWRERLLLWPSLSATAVLLERLTGPRAAAPPPALYVEDKEVPSCPVVDSGGRSSSAPTPQAGLPSAISSVTSGRRL
jgi:hypothetical protein